MSAIVHSYEGAELWPQAVGIDMKAVVCHTYGAPDVLRCEEVVKPIAGENEVLIKVRAASLNPLDYGLMRGKPYIIRVFSGLRKPKVTRPGRDVAGQVEAVGRNVAQIKPGDAVFGVCTAGSWGDKAGGAFAEYACTSESALAIKPDNVTFEQAASSPVAALTALQGLRDKGHIHPGQKVLINGAGGGVGTFAVQIAKSFGATVTGVCSTRNVEMVRSIGADQVIDYTQEDFTKSDERYDLIFDCIANHSLSARRSVLTRNGICVMVGGPPDGRMIRGLARLIIALILSRFMSQKFVTFMAKSNKEDLIVIHELMKTGKVIPVIDNCYTLSEVPDAIRYLEEHHARGKVVITLPGNRQ